MLGTQVPPSIGGQGEVRNSVFENDLDYGIDRMIDALDSREERFDFLPDIDQIADEWLSLIDGEKSEETKAQLTEWLKTTIPGRFGDTYQEILPILDKESQDTIADKVSEKLVNLRYNLVDDFSKEVIKIVGDKNVKTNKTTRRRSKDNG
jgi:hypothetical protein